MPIDFETGLPKPTDVNKTVWTQLTPKKFRAVANLAFHVLFATPAEESSFKLMTKQFSTQIDSVEGILVNHGDRVMVLNRDATFSPVTGAFVPNFIDVPYIEDNPLAEELLDLISDWVNGRDQAESLLRHLSTILQPHWSAGKYLLLLGDGSNGKGTLLRLLLPLVGGDNTSKVTRQAMAAQRPIVAKLNGKLLNLVMDGPKEFLKDSSTEKTLIVGEPLWLEMKYENEPVEVMTNALFIEGLNEEPIASDKTPALQRRLVRFHFPNVYQRDTALERKMMSKEMQAALLTLFIRYWTTETNALENLAITAKSLDLQLQAVWSMSPVMRFLESMAIKDLKFLTRVQQQLRLDEFIPPYRMWLEANGYKGMEDDYILRQLKNHFVIDRKTFRIDSKPTSRRYIKSIFPDTLNAINILMETAEKEVLAITED